MDPVLKYAGSKRWAVERLRSIYTRDRRLVEPFVGSMAVALGLLPDRALLCDANPHLINFHLRLRDSKPFSIAMINDEQFYYAQRAVFNTLAAFRGPHTHEAAEIYYFMNRSCFNGLVRHNRSGEFNVPFGNYAAVAYRSDFSEYATHLQRWQIKCQPWQATIAELTPTDFLFADPPYDETFDTYSGDAFSWEQQTALAEALAAHAGPVVATNNATERVLALYRSLGFEVGTTAVRRSISSSGDRTPAQEMIAHKNLDEGGAEVLTVSSSQ